MAETFTAAHQIKRITLSATPLVATEINFADYARSVLVKFYDSAGTASGSGRISYDDTDGGAITTAESVLLLAGETLSLPLLDERSRQAIRQIHVASTVASGIVEIVSSEIE